jgi:AraC family transcriptional regulator of adaptative response/methylated-DNA-[protein]-cysteine methyltransferase
VVRACRLLAQPNKRAQSDEVAAQVGLSPYYFQRLFKKHTGITPQEYRRRALAERAKEELSQARSVTEAVFAAGYSSSSRFYDGPARELGMKAREARSGARDREVRYAVRASTLGRVLVAWTDEGVCDVSFGDDDAEVREALAERFPRAIVAEADLPPWVDAVIDLVERGGDAKGAARIPTDIRGTAFQERVWRELRRIPRGETRTYSEVAQAIGAPQAVRAVAQACATNRVAVVVPCHRVVRSDGDVASYRWGRPRKEELLRREGAKR